MTRRAIAALLPFALLAACTGEFPAGRSEIRAAETAFDADRLVGALEEIEAWHTEHATGVADALARGTAARSIETAFAGEACTPHEELMTLWRWRNGEDAPAPFVWYHDFLSAEEARAEYGRLLLNPLVRWDPHYVPVFRFEGEWYASHCGPRTTRAGPVVHFFVEDEPRIAYVNLTTFIATMAQALRSGAVSWKDGAMAEDIGELRRLHQEHNPGYPFPYHVPEGG